MEGSSPRDGWVRELGDMSMRWRAGQTEQSPWTPPGGRGAQPGALEDTTVTVRTGSACWEEWEEQRMAGANRPRRVTVQAGGQWANSLQAVMGEAGKAEDRNKGVKDRANNWLYVKTRALGSPWGEKPLAWGLVCVGTGPAKWAVRAWGQAVGRTGCRSWGGGLAQSSLTARGTPCGWKGWLGAEGITQGPSRSDHRSYEQDPYREARCQDP